VIWVDCVLDLMAYGLVDCVACPDTLGGSLSEELVSLPLDWSNNVRQISPRRKAVRKSE
jgi:hypothetical protein